MDTIDHVSHLWRHAKLPLQALQDLGLTGSAAALPSSFTVSKAAQASIALAALAAAHYWQLRTGHRQQVSVDRRHAAIECRSDHYFAIDGHPVIFSDPLTGLYPCGDGGWVRIHANFAHHREGALALLERNPAAMESPTPCAARAPSTSRRRRQRSGCRSSRCARSSNGTPIHKRSPSSRCRR